MLLDTIVKLKWHPRNKERYENLGYNYTKIGQEFEVKIDDLSKGSPVKVHVKCDCENCKNPNNIKFIPYNTYNRLLHNDEKYYCQQCGTNVFGRKKADKTILKNSKSFEKWCIDNKKQDILNLWDYDLNDCKPSEVTYKSSKKCWFKCHRGLHDSELKNISDFVGRNVDIINCHMCNSFAQWGIDNLGEDFLEKYWSDENTLNPWKISCKSSKKRVWIKCQEKDYHEDYNMLCSSFVIDNQRCPYCTNHHGKVHPKDSLGQYILDNYEQDFLNNIWSEKNNKSAFEYTLKTRKTVWWKCIDEKHEDFKRQVLISYMTDFRCPKCVQERRESIIQEKVRLYLEETNYTILHENNCTLYPINIIIPPNNANISRKPKKLKYDNEIIIENCHLFIEVMGEQHKISNNLFHKRSAKIYNTTLQQELQYQIAKDKYKEQYVYNQGENYYYLALWYFDFKKEEIWKQLINNKIKEIIQKAKEE